MNRPNNGDENIENPDQLSAEDLAAIERERKRRAAWRHPAGRGDIDPIDLSRLRVTELGEFPTPRSGD